MSATAIALMIESLVTMYTVKFIIFVIEKHCIVISIISSYQVITSKIAFLL